MWLNSWALSYKTPNRKHFSETVIPKTGEVKACIDPIPLLAFTTDCWTSQLLIRSLA